MNQTIIILKTKVMRSSPFLIMSLFLLLIIGSCEKEKEVELPPKGSTQDYLLTVLVTDQSGNNLLNSASFAHLKMFYVVDGKEKEAVFPHLHLDNPRLMTMNLLEYGELGKQNMLVLPTNTLDENKITTTILKWGDVTDNIRTEVNRGPGVVQVTKVWWNDELVWNFEIATQQYKDGIRVSHRFVKVVR